MQNDSFPFEQTIVWQPNPQWIKNSNLNKFMADYKFKNYDQLFSQSVDDIAWFWDAVIKDMDIQFYKPYKQVVDLSKGLQFPRWCVDGN
jgi:acetyl-CoA synthetase